MRRRGIVAAAFLISIAALGLSITTARADENLTECLRIRDKPAIY